MGFDVGFDPIAFCAALFAVVFAYRESRRNNEVILKLRDCSAYHTESVDEEAHYEFRMLIQNCGRPLHDLSLNLTFTGKRGAGRSHFLIPMRTGQPKFSGEFAKGMFAEFVLRTDRMDGNDFNFLGMLEDPRRQAATICVFSQRYFAKAFPIGGLRDRMKYKWGNWAGKVNGALRRVVGTNPEGHPIIKTPHILPIPVVLLTPVRNFLSFCRDEARKRSDWQAPKTKPVKKMAPKKKSKAKQPKKKKKA